MKSRFALTVVLSFILFGIFSCSGGGSTSQQAKTDTVAAPVKPIAVYVSTDGKYTFSVLEKKGDDRMILKDETTGKVYQLTVSPSASGVKYSSDDDYFFWTKGKDFMWGKGDSLYTSGKIKE